MPDDLDDLRAAVRRAADQRAIERLVVDYQHLCDGGWNGSSHADPDALTALFTPDGEYSINPERPPATGTAEIRAAFVRLQTSMPWIIHYATNIAVDIRRDGGRADLRAQGLAMFRREGTAHLAFGTYRGEAARTSEGWRLARWVFELAGTQQLP